MPSAGAPAEDEGDSAGFGGDDFGEAAREEEAGLELESPHVAESIPFELEPAMERPGKNDKPAGEEEDPFAKIAELMMTSAPQPIPEMFSTAKPSRRPGAAVLWGLGVVLLLAGLAGALLGLQEKMVETFPATARLYEGLGVRKAVVGAGLTFSNYQSERQTVDGSETLIVRGVITNNTDQRRDVPLLRLVLYEDQAPLQERVINPPQTTLEPHGSVGFRITLDQPDPHARRFEVTFTATPPPSASAAR